MNWYFWIPFRLIMIAGCAAIGTMAYMIDPFKFGWMILGIPCSILYFFFQTQEENSLLDEVREQLY